MATAAVRVRIRSRLYAIKYYPWMKMAEEKEKENLSSNRKNGESIGNTYLVFKL